MKDWGLLTSDIMLYQLRPPPGHPQFLLLPLEKVTEKMLLWSKVAFDTQISRQWTTS